MTNKIFFECMLNPLVGLIKPLNIVKCDRCQYKGDEITK
jgi:hypothetical protein